MWDRVDNNQGAEVRLEELVWNLRVLIDTGLVTRSDELAAARRSFQHLSVSLGVVH